MKVEAGPARCARCGGVFPLEDFGKRGDGHNPVCKACERERAADYRKRYRNEINRRKRLKYAADPEGARRYQREWVQAHPDQVKAFRGKGKSPCIRLWGFRQALPEFQALSPWGDGREVWLAHVPMSLISWYDQYVRLIGEAGRYETAAVPRTDGSLVVIGAVAPEEEAAVSDEILD